MGENFCLALALEIYPCPSEAGIPRPSFLFVDSFLAAAKARTLPNSRPLCMVEQSCSLILLHSCRQSPALQVVAIRGSTGLVVLSPAKPTPHLPDILYCMYNSHCYLMTSNVQLWTKVVISMMIIKIPKKYNKISAHLLCAKRSAKCTQFNLTLKLLSLIFTTTLWKRCFHIVPLYKKRNWELERNTT